MLNEAIHQPSRIFIKTDKASLYQFQVENPNLDPFIKILLRSYAGIFTQFVAISEEELGRRNSLSAEKTTELLILLQKRGILDYEQRSELPRIIFTEDRVEAKYLTLSAGNYADRLKDATRRLDAVIAYTTSTHLCRNVQLLRYFGDNDPRRCGKCDVCIERNKMELSDLEFENIRMLIAPVLQAKPCQLNDIIASSAAYQEDKVMKVLQWLIEQDIVGISPNSEYYWKN